MRTRRAILGWMGLVLVSCSPASRELPGREWPAEPEDEAHQLSEICKGFRKDLSGAVWNPVTRSLWVCRNGPGAKSKLWVLVEDGSGQLQLGVRDEEVGEWVGLGDSEGVTFADFEEEVVYVMVEGEEKILELDVSSYGELKVNRTFDTSPFLDADGRDGAEGITFVPDEHLARAGFVDRTGAARISRKGMGGLMLVGHQSKGAIHAFDLDRATGEVDYVGEYRIAAAMDAGVDTRVVGLEFDRSTGQLLVLHGPPGRNLLSVLQLASTEVEDQEVRSLHLGPMFKGPSDRDYEGIAVMPYTAGGKGERPLFMTVDNGKKHALMRFDRFTSEIGE